MLRANIPPRNFKEWYETFGVEETDKMYIEPDKRLIIW
jgi:putative endopeptidase